MIVGAWRGWGRSVVVVMSGLRCAGGGWHYLAVRADGCAGGQSGVEVSTALCIIIYQHRRPKQVPNNKDGCLGPAPVLLLWRGVNGESGLHRIDFGNVSVQLSKTSYSVSWHTRLFA